MKIALLLKRLGLTSTLMHSLGAASIAGSVSLWGRSAAVSDKRSEGPRRAARHLCGSLASNVLSSRQGSSGPRSDARAKIQATEDLPPVVSVKHCGQSNFVVELWRRATESR
jgi:hypothetical protein